MSSIFKKFEKYSSGLTAREFRLFRLIGLCFLVLVFFAASAALVSAQEASVPKSAGSAKNESGALKQGDPASPAKEPPLTQADIDAIIKIANSDDELAEDLGISPLRLELALTKVSFGMLILAGADPKLVYGQDVNEALVLSQEELKLIAANMDRIAGADLE